MADVISAVGATLAGAVAFVAAQAMLWVRADAVAGADTTSAGWFLNSGYNALTVAAAVALAAVLVSLPRRMRPLHAAASCGAGAALAMVVALVAIGPGTIFPIVILVGMLVIGVAACTGSACAFALRGLIRHRG